MEQTLAKSIKAVAYLVILLLVVGIAYAGYITLTYFDGIGV
jgi:hypothetical protein